MSKTLKLSAIVAAFLGDATEGLSIVADAFSAAVVTMAVHGTRAPVDEACAMIAALKGRTLREKAMRAGLDAIAADLGAVAPGKVPADAADALADDLSARFTLAAGEIMTAPKVTYAKPSAADVATRALKALAGLTDPQVAAMLRTAAGTELCARFARIAAVQASVADAGAVVKRIRAAKVQADAAISAASAPVDAEVMAG